MKYHNGTGVGTNSPDGDNVPFLPPHLITAKHTRKLKYAVVDAFITFFFICIVVLSTTTTYLPPSEPQTSCFLLVSRPFRLSGSTGALSHSIGAETQSYKSVSTGMPVSSSVEENSGFHAKFKIKKVGSVKPTLHFIYLQNVVGFEA